MADGMELWVRVLMPMKTQPLVKELMHVNLSWLRCGVLVVMVTACIRHASDTSPGAFEDPSCRGHNAR
ncbi:hypothetical protein TNCV_4483481 [Trichonephila clavipes]|nr:hypothetical protein TNCV_4483481 [Trichonephila clavipes]